MTEAQPGIRLDKWLCYCRFFKTRALAGKAVTSGTRVNDVRLSKASALVRPGDEITFMQARAVRYVRVNALGYRRSPAAEAQTLYTDLAPAKVAD